MAERRFSEKEVSAIIQQATALQLEGAAMPNGATLEQVRQAASELGISPELVNQAALQVDARKETSGFQFFGAPISNRISLVVEGTLAEDNFSDLTQAIRSATGRVGAAKRVGSIFEWTSDAEYPMHLALTPRDGKTCIDVSARFDSYAVLIVLFPMLLSIVGWLIPSALLGGKGVLLWGAAQLVTYLLTRALFQKVARKKLAALVQTTEYVANFVTQKAQDLEPVRGSSIGTLPDIHVPLSQ